MLYYPISIDIIHDIVAEVDADSVEVDADSMDVALRVVLP